MVEHVVNFDEPRERAGFVRETNGLTGKHRITIVKYRNRRTDAQNRYYRGVIVECLRCTLRNQGDICTNDEAHVFLADKFLMFPVIHSETGEVLGNSRKSTSKLDVQEFCEFIELCIAYLADSLNIVVPPPEWNRSGVGVGH